MSNPMDTMTYFSVKSNWFTCKSELLVWVEFLDASLRTYLSMVLENPLMILSCDGNREGM
jgi:malate/lactate dehydrogenase